MELFINQVLAGIATGAIYACMALAVVMIYQAIDHLNFAQGEMAMFSTFIAWQLLQWGVPYWWAFLLTLAISFGGGIAIERLLFKPLAKAPVLTNVAGFIALFAILRRVSRETGVAMLIVEQNAALALDMAEHAYLLETGRIVMDAPAAVIGADESIRRAYLGY